MPGNGARILFMPPERLHLFLQISDIEQFAQVIPGRTDQPISVELVPLQVCAGVFVRM
jgi:hypothetical protein